MVGIERCGSITTVDVIVNSFSNRFPKCLANLKYRKNFTSMISICSVHFDSIIWIWFSFFPLSLSNRWMDQTHKFICLHRWQYCTEYVSDVSMHFVRGSIAAFRCTRNESRHFVRWRYALAYALRFHAVTKYVNPIEEYVILRIVQLFIIEKFYS